MEIISYQLVIFFSVFVLGVFNKDYAFFLAIVWTIFTFSMLYFAPLILLQLTTIWIAWSLVEKVSSAGFLGNQVDVDQASAEEELSKTNFRKPTITLPAPKSSKPLIEPTFAISGSAHRDFLHRTIRNASGEVVILSGWISHKVVDNYFLTLIDGALSNGCTIYVGYGFTNHDGNHVTSWRSNMAVKRLQKLNREVPKRGLIHIRKFPNHEKLLVSDEGVCVFGSYNWLSTTNFLNNERSIIVESKDAARVEIERVKRTIFAGGKRSPNLVA